MMDGKKGDFFLFDRASSEHDNDNNTNKQMQVVLIGWTKKNGKISLGMMRLIGNRTAAQLMVDSVFVSILFLL